MREGVKIEEMLPRSSLEPRFNQIFNKVFIKLLTTGGGICSCDFKR